VAKKKFYAVRKGHKTGIYTEWFGPGGAQIQIKGFPGAVYRGFANHSEAISFLQEAPSLSQAPLFEKEPHVVVYTDGGAVGNPGPGGYGVVIVPPQGERTELSGGYRLTTNNRMELMAGIVALEYLDDNLPILLHSDSRYMVDAINKKWALSWRKKDWKKADGNLAKNPDLWERLLKRLETLQVIFRWVKGHAGHDLNERCDQLAGQAMAQSNLPADLYYEALSNRATGRR
jgi:ribonuclease HI